MATVLHPRGNKITVLMDPPKTKSEGGIDLANAQIDDHETGTVLEVGSGALLARAKYVDYQVQAILSGQELDVALRPIRSGDRVLFSRYAGIRATVGGQNIAILEDGEHHSEIIGVLEGEGE